MSLSDKIIKWKDVWDLKNSAIGTKDVKEAVKELREEINWRLKALAKGEYTSQQTNRNIKEKIDEIFGDKLI